MLELTQNEELILLSVWKLKDNAYGTTIRENFKKITQKTLNYGSLYNTLYRLLRRGFVAARESESRAEKGGRRKILYTLTPEGKGALREAQARQRLAWEGIPDFAYGKRK